MADTHAVHQQDVEARRPLQRVIPRLLGEVSSQHVARPQRIRWTRPARSGDAHIESLMALGAALQARVGQGGSKECGALRHALHAHEKRKAGVLVQVGIRRQCLEGQLQLFVARGSR